MYSTFAHQGVEHIEKTTSFSHFLKTDGLKIVAISVIIGACIAIAAKLGSSSKPKDTKKEKENE